MAHGSPSTIIVCDRYPTVLICLAIVLQKCCRKAMFSVVCVCLHVHRSWVSVQVSSALPVQGPGLDPQTRSNLFNFDLEHCNWNHYIKSRGKSRCWYCLPVCVYKFSIRIGSRTHSWWRRSVLIFQIFGNLRFYEEIQKIPWNYLVHNREEPEAHSKSANTYGMTSYKYLLLFCLSISLVMELEPFYIFILCSQNEL